MASAAEQKKNKKAPVWRSFRPKAQISRDANLLSSAHTLGGGGPRDEECGAKFISLCHSTEATAVFSTSYGSCVEWGLKSLSRRQRLHLELLYDGFGPRRRTAEAELLLQRMINTRS